MLLDALSRLHTTAAGVFVLLLTMSAAVQAQTTPLLSEIKTLASDSPPSEKSLEIPADGDYTITLTDLAFPAAMAAIKLAITRADTVVTTLEDVEVAHKFTATKGSHVIRVVGIPGAAFPSDSFGVEVRSADGAVVLQYSDTLFFTPADIPGQGRILGSLTSTGGSYRVVLSDFKLPKALGTLILALTRSGSSDLFTMSAAGESVFSLPAGNYDVSIIGQAQAGETEGLFGVRISSVTTSANVFTQTMPIGTAITKLGTVTVAAGVHSLTFADLAFPIGLAQGGAVAAIDGVAAVTLPAPATSSFTATAGEYSIYAYATPGTTTASGSYGVELRKQSGEQIFSAARAVGGAAGDSPTYALPIDVAAAGTYKVRLTDFEIPARFEAVSLAATQAGTLIGSLSSPGSVDLTLTPGKLFLLVIAKPSTTGSALFGVDVTQAGSSTALFEGTQGVGSLFDVRKVSITTAGKYNVGLTDLKFPKRFVDLVGVVTRGAERKGSILGGGTFSFDATPGDYLINFIAEGALLDATKSAKQKVGTYAMTVAPATPAPTITLSINPTQVQSGGMVDISWSTTDADTCTATGGWSGAKATAKTTERSGAITAATTFTMTCSGAGGSATQSASVSVTAAAKKGGGGGIEWLTIEALLAAGVASAVGRRRI